MIIRTMKRSKKQFNVSKKLRKKRIESVKQETLEPELRENAKQVLSSRHLSENQKIFEQMRKKRTFPLTIHDIKSSANRDKTIGKMF